MLQGLGEVDEGDDHSWEKLEKDILEATAENINQKLSKLTEIVWEKVINRLAMESRGKEKKIIEKKGIKRSHESGGPSSVGEEKEEYCLVSKQKRQKTSANQKKQKTGNKKEKKKTKTRTKKNPYIGKNPIVEFTALGLEPPPDMPEEFKSRIKTLGGTEINLVIQKFLQVTDLNPSQGRLLMPSNQLRSLCLNEDEQEKCMIGIGVQAVLVEPSLEVSNIHLNRWLVGSSYSYVLNSQWNEVVKKYAGGLKPMVVVQVWSFRVGPKSKLGFALIKVRDGKMVV
ncbi:hypothetical protein PTKIN_Ptkin01aG0384100 [Pterospermum kingtungense]